MANNQTLISRMNKRGLILAFKGGATCGVSFPKDKKFADNETFLAKNINQIKTITELEWNANRGLC